MFDISAIEDALKKGGRLHTFRSGGGLRVARIENKGVLVGYGEHPALETAISHANQDCLDGHLSYDQQYGEKGKYPHYLTGTTHSSTSLDAWVKAGHTFDAFFDESQNAFVVELYGYQHENVPKDVEERVIASGNPEEWKNEKRGYAFRTSPYTFPGNGKQGVSTQILSSPEGKKGDGFFYRIVKTAFAESLWKAVVLAEGAEAVEAEEKVM